MSFHFFKQSNSACRALCAVFVLGALVMAGSVSAATCRVTVTGAGSNDGATWGDAMSLQTALAATSGCDEAWVKAGTYTPTTDGDRTISFNILPDVKVYGGFDGTETQRSARDSGANLTILSGDLNDDDDADFANNGDNSHHVVFMDGTTPAGTITASTVLDGFTIRSGNADVAAVQSGGGLYCDGRGHECSPSLSNVTFSSNSAGTGGAMYNDGSDGGTSSPSLSDVTFSGNSADFSGGAMFNFGFYGGICNPALSNVTFTGNKAIEYFGGAMTNIADGSGSSCSPTLINVTFSGNSAVVGGAVYNQSGGDIDGIGTSSPTFSNVTFSDNSASGGGAIANNAYGSGISSPRFSDVTFSGNVADSVAGAVYNVSQPDGISSPTFSNVTFTDNSAGGDGGAMYNLADDGGTSSPILGNVTFSGNSAGERGGAMVNHAFRGQGISSPTLNNVTFSGNNAVQEGGAMYNLRESGSSIPILRNVIVWGNTAANGAGVSNSSATPVIDHSVIQGSGGSGSNWNGSLGIDAGGNHDADPKLGLLADNGGPTQTMLPGAGSSVMDAGNDATCATSSVNDLDQRGIERPQGAHCDIGAVEVEQYALSVIVTGSGSVSTDTNSTPISGGIASCTEAGGINCAEFHALDANVTLNASADVGQHFVSWSGDCSGSAASASVSMDAGKTCDASFARSSYNVGGVVSGLAGSGLVLQLNGGNDQPISADGSFVFATAVPYGTSYAVSISTQPTSPVQNCTVSNGSGNMPDSDVTSVVVDCRTNSYTIGGSVSGLSGSGLTLQLNGGNNLPVAGNGSFTFPIGVASGGSYLVSVATQPSSPKQTCSVSNASGTVTVGNISDVAVSCTDAQAKLSLAVDDGYDFARYGQTRDYLVTLSNSGDAPANGVAVVANMSAGLDSGQAHWKCMNVSAGATCVPNGVGPLADSVTLPESGSVNWLVTVPVKLDASDDSVTMDVQATGATPVSDVDILVIYRDGFDVVNADGTQGATPAPDSAVILRSDASDSLRLPPASGDGIDTIRTFRDSDTTIKIQRLTLGQSTWVRLLQHPQDGVERTSAWTPVAADATLTIGSVAGKDEQRIILLEGASQALSLPLTD